MNKKRSPVEEEVQLEMTPMIDVTFQLLIFFIITLKFRMLEKKLHSHLPTDFGSMPGDPIDEEFVEIALEQRLSSDVPLRERETSLRFNDEEVEASSARQACERISSKLAAFRSRHPDARGKINVGPGVPHAWVVAVIDLLNNSGFESVTFKGVSRVDSASDARKTWIKMRERLNDMR